MHILKTDLENILLTKCLVIDDNPLLHDALLHTRL